MICQKCVDGHVNGSVVSRENYEFTRTELKKEKDPLVWSRVLTQMSGQSQLSVIPGNFACAEAAQARGKDPRPVYFDPLVTHLQTPTLLALTRPCNSILPLDLITILISRGLRINNPSSYGIGCENS